MTRMSNSKHIITQNKIKQLEDDGYPYLANQMAHFYGLTNDEKFREYLRSNKAKDDYLTEKCTFFQQIAQRLVENINELKGVLTDGR